MAGRLWKVERRARQERGRTIYLVVCDRVIPLSILSWQFCSVFSEGVPALQTKVENNGMERKHITLRVEIWWGFCRCADTSNPT